MIDTVFTVFHIAAAEEVEVYNFISQSDNKVTGGGFHQLAGAHTEVEDAAGFIFHFGGEPVFEGGIHTDER